MGCNSSKTVSASVKVAIAKASAAELKERMVKLEQERKIWETNSAKFEEWLNLNAEEVLEPELEIVDPHHHLWDMRMLKGLNMYGIFRQQYYMSDEFLRDFVGGGHNITHTVFVSTHAFFNADIDPVMAPLGEVQFVQGIAAQCSSHLYGKFRGAAGIVGVADLSKFGA